MKSFYIVIFLLGLNLSVFSQNNYKANQVIVMMNGEQNLDYISSIYNKIHHFDLTLSQTISEKAKIYLLEFDSNKTTVKDLIHLLKNDDQFSLVQANHNNITQRNISPNDLEYPVQWSLKNTATARIFAPQAWSISTDGVTQNGDTVVMAVIDGGIDTNHIDLNLFKNRHEIKNNGIDDDSNGYVDDYDGWNAYSHSGNITSDAHGTHVAGIIGANTNNYEGIAGIVWGGLVLPINASSGIESVVLEGYGYALELRSKYNESNGDSGAYIVVANSSFGVDFAAPDDFPIWCAFYDSLGAAGMLSVTATSNSGVDVDLMGDIPTTCPSNYMIAVSNVNQNGNILGGYGATHIDIAAPGTNIRSTTPGHNYGYMTGTSMATPHVTGVIGAMYSSICGVNLSFDMKKPDSLAMWVKNSLFQSVDSVTNLIGKNATNGRLNMFKALQSMQMASILISSTMTPATDSSSNNGSIVTSVSGGSAPYSYLWSTSDTSSNLNQVYPGHYSVTVTENYGCVQTDSINVWTVGLNNILKKPSYSIFPNPNNGLFHINLDSEFNPELKLKIYSSIGEMVFFKKVSSSNKQIKVNINLPRGFYIIEINGSENQILIIE